MSKYTLQPHGPETWAIYKGIDRKVILSECSEETAQKIVDAINPKTSGLIARLRKVEAQLEHYKTEEARANEKRLREFESKLI